MALLRPLERRILACAGTCPTQVASAHGVTVAEVERIWARCGRSTSGTRTAREGFSFFDSLMRSNRGTL